MSESDNINKHLEKIQNEQNNRSIPNFEGYSPIEMQYIITETFGKNSPIELLNITESEYQMIPFLNQIKYILNYIVNHGELKLTAKGFLPTKIVSDIYNQGFIKDEMIELGISKLYKEADLMSVNLTRILIEISGLVKKRNGILSLTKNGRKIYSNNFDLLKLTLETFGTKFNWAYYDGYGDNHIGQFGFGFSLILLSKYGLKIQPDNFYSTKYFQAFPELIEEIQHSEFDTVENQAEKCYSLRTFDRFLEYFGLIQINSEKKWKFDKYIIKTELFDKLIKIRPHNNA